MTLSDIIIVAIALALLGTRSKVIFFLFFSLPSPPPGVLEDDPLLLQLSWAFAKSVEVIVCVLIL